MGPSLDALAKVLATSPPGVARQVGRATPRGNTGKPNPSKPEHVVELRALAERMELPDPISTRRRRPAGAVARRVVEEASPRLKDVPLPDLDDRGIDAYANAYEELIDMPAGVEQRRHRALPRADRIVQVAVGAPPADGVPVGRQRSPRPAAKGPAETATPNHLRKAAMGATDQRRRPQARHRRHRRHTSAEARTSLVRIYDEWCYLSFTRGILGCRDGCRGSPPTHLRQLPADRPGPVGRGDGDNLECTEARSDCRNPGARNSDDTSRSTPPARS